MPQQQSPPNASTPLSALGQQLARLLAAPGASPVRGAPPELPEPSEPPEPPAVLVERREVTVVRAGGLVAKAHAAGTDAAALALRLRLAAGGALAGIVLPPASPEAVRLPGPEERLATTWPYGTPVDPEDETAVPWEAAGALLAALHAVDVPAVVSGGRPSRVPPMAGPVRTARVVARLWTAGVGGTPGLAEARRAVENVWEGLPAWCRAEEPSPPLALCHGDFHLGQLVRLPLHGPRREEWLLIDVDDMGLGDPAWDLARPAAWYASGLLAPEDWHRLLTAYLATQTASAASAASATRAPRTTRTVRPVLPGQPDRAVDRAGRAGRVPPSALPEGDPWPRLDAPARALTAHHAARALASAAVEGRALDGDEIAFVDSCLRIGHPRRRGTV
ncbi:phosphotransferase family protein [Streptomyces sp. 4N509B]|uniref:phosphotransferase family protein n=1 Tax=Streptomyces sp. 4N509B TaxID=3457413 RepID=UPI003FD51E51